MQGGIDFTHTLHICPPALVTDCITDTEYGLKLGFCEHSAEQLGSVRRNFLTA